MRIAGDDDVILREKDQRESAFDLEKSIAQRPGQSAFVGARHQMKHNFGIAGGLEDRSVFFEIAAQFNSIGEIAVMRDRHLSFAARDR